MLFVPKLFNPASAIAYECVRECARCVSLRVGVCVCSLLLLLRRLATPKIGEIRVPSRRIEIVRISFCLSFKPRKSVETIKTAPINSRLNSLSDASAFMLIASMVRVLSFQQTIEVSLLLVGATC